MPGLIGRKIGMTQIFDDDGKAVGVTVLEVGPCPVVQIKTTEQDGYDAVQLGFGRVKEGARRKPACGHRHPRGLGLCLPRVLAEFASEARGRAGPGTHGRPCSSVRGVNVTGTTQVGPGSRAS